MRALTVHDLGYEEWRTLANKALVVRVTHLPTGRQAQVSSTTEDSRALRLRAIEELAQQLAEADAGQTALDLG